MAIKDYLPNGTDVSDIVIGMIVTFLLCMAMFQCVGTNGTGSVKDPLAEEYSVVRLGFSEPMDTVGLFDISNYHIYNDPRLYDSLLMGPVWQVEVQHIYKPEDIPWDSLTYVYVRTEEQTKVGRYKILVENVFDTAGNEINMSKNYWIYEK